MAAPVFDAKATKTGDGVSTITWTHTTSGSDRLLTVAVHVDNGVAPSITSVKYNTVALTAVGEANNGNAHVDLFRLINPASGANTVEIVLASAVDRLVGGSLSFTGANQTTPLGTLASATGGDSPSVTVTSATDEIVLDAVTIANNPTLTVDGSQTERYNVNINSAGRSAGSTEAGAASVSMDWTQSATEGWGIVGVSVKPVAAPVGPPAGSLMMMGLGK